MPTSPRELTGGTGWYQPTALFSNLRADEGHRPLREREDFTAHRGTAEYFRGPLHTRRKRGHPRKAQRAGIPLIRPGLRPVHLPRRGRLPPAGASSGGGLPPAGGFLRRGASSGGVLQDQPFQGFFQVFLVYAGIIDDQAVQVRGLGIKGAEGLDLQALGEECLGQGFVR